MTCSKKNDKMKAMLEQVITACVKTQLLKLSGQKDKKPWEICQGSHPWLGTPLHASHLTAVATLWIYMQVTGRFSNLTEITSIQTQFLSWKYSEASFQFTILWRWKKSTCYYNLPACMTELNPFHMNFQEWCHTCVFCVGICSASAILL
jgi:hypothetical protein